MSQTPSVDATEWYSLCGFTLVLSTITASVYGLLAAVGAGLRGFSLSEPADFRHAFDLLAWMSITVAPTLTWIFVGISVFVGGVGLWTWGWFRSAPRPVESVVGAVLRIEFCALAPVVLLFVAPFVLWPIYWIESGFGTCVPPDCGGVPAVP